MSYQNSFIDTIMTHPMKTATLYSDNRVLVSSMMEGLGVLSILTYAVDIADKLIRSERSVRYFCVPLFTVFYLDLPRPLTQARHKVQSESVLALSTALRRFHIIIPARSVSVNPPP